MDPDRQPGSIASHVAKTLESFRNLELALSITAGSNYVLEGATLNDFPLQIENNFTRFKMWVGDQVAHRSGRFSLDYRLREAEHLQEQVIYLLTDICESLHTATLLVNDDPSFLEKTQQEGEDGISQDDDSHSSFPDSDDDDESDVCDGGPTLSLLTLSSDIGEAIDCLLRLSVAIANPAPLERFRKFGAGPSEGIPFYESCDIAYARDNFPTITDELARALGKFIARRRQFFKYRHHERSASGEEPVISDKETETCHTETFAATVTSSLPERSKTLANLDTQAFVNNEDIRADAGMWQMSYVTPASDWRLPPRPSAAEQDDIFKCPFCCRKISAKTDTAWEQHVFGDLRPYTCLFSECIESNLDFDRHESWQSHLLEYHWRSWLCPFKYQQPFSAAVELSRHIREDHLPTGTDEEIKSIAALGERDASNNTSSPCPLCDYSLTGLAEYIDHVGFHLEQLALFALSSLEKGERDPNLFGSFQELHRAGRARQTDWSMKQKGGSNEESIFKPRVDTVPTYSFSTMQPMRPPVLQEHPGPSLGPPSKGNEAAFLDDTMSDMGSPHLPEPTFGKQAVRRESWSKDIKLEPPVATPDVLADERETKIESGIQYYTVKSVAWPQRESATNHESDKKPPAGYFGSSLDPPPPFTDDDSNYLMPADLQSIMNLGYPDCSESATLQSHTGYPAHSMPAIPQPTWYHHPDVSLPVVPQSQIHYLMPTHPQSAWYDSPGCSGSTTLQPLTGYSGYYMPQQHHTVVQAAAFGSIAEAPVPCTYPGCTTRPFRRKADLERHIRDTHFS